MLPLESGLGAGVPANLEDAGNTSLDLMRCTHGQSFWKGSAIVRISAPPINLTVHYNFDQMQAKFDLTDAKIDWKTSSVWLFTMSPDG